MTLSAEQRKQAQLKLMMGIRPHPHNGSEVCVVPLRQCVAKQKAACWCERNKHGFLRYDLTYRYTLTDQPGQLVWLVLTASDSKHWISSSMIMPSVHDLSSVQTSLKVNGQPVVLLASPCSVSMIQVNSTVLFCCIGPPCDTSITVWDMASGSEVDSVRGENCSSLVHFWQPATKYAFAYSACDLETPWSYQCYTDPTTVSLTEAPMLVREESTVIEMPNDQLNYTEPQPTLTLNGQALDLFPAGVEDDQGDQCKVRLSECDNSLTFCCGHTNHFCRVKMVSPATWASNMSCVTLNQLDSQTGQLELSYTWKDINHRGVFYCDLIPAPHSKTLMLTYDDKEVDLLAEACLIKVVNANKELKFCCFHNTSICQAKIFFDGSELTHSPCAAINVDSVADRSIVFADSLCNRSTSQNQYVCRVLAQNTIVSVNWTIIIARSMAVVFGIAILFIPMGFGYYQRELDAKRKKTKLDKGMFPLSQ